MSDGPAWVIWQKIIRQWSKKVINQIKRGKVSPTDPPIQQSDIAKLHIANLSLGNKRYYNLLIDYELK